MQRLFSLLVLGFLLSATLKAAAYERIVSLDVCSDWMLARYALPDQVAGLSPLFADNRPGWVKGSWPVHDGTLEKVLSLGPDLVITGEYNAIQLRQRLQELGVHVAVFSLPETLAELADYEQAFAALLGRETPAIHRSRTPQPSTGLAPRLLLLGANGIGTGRATIANELLTLAGWENYLSEAGYPRLDLEKLVADPPDAIFWSAPGANARSNDFLAHPALRHVMQGRPFETMDARDWQCPGPWTWQQSTTLVRFRQQWQNR